MPTLDQVFEHVPETPWHEMDGELIVLSMKSGYYFSLNEIGKFIWEKTDGKNTLKQILDEILTTYEVDEETAKNDLMSIITRMLDEKLIKAL